MKRSRLDALIMEQEQLESLTREDIEAVQLERLNGLLKRERARGGFYKGLPEKLSCLDELATLPFTGEEDLAQSGGAMLLCSQAEIKRVITDTTSGTTGRAKRVFYTPGDCENTVRLFMAGLGELVYPGSVTMICMPFSGAYGLGELIAEAIERLGARPLKCGGALSYGELKALMERERPDSYVGMPSALLSMLRACGKGSLKRALVSGDCCPESVIGCSEELLGSRLFPHYGSREMGLGGAVTCPAHEGMHLRENHVIAEIVDEKGAPLPKGEYGQLIITTIGMEALPLIRYRTGDYGRILPEPCPCGSSLIRLDGLRRLDGILALDEALFKLPQLVDFKARRRERGIEISALTTGGGEGEIFEAASEAMPGEEIKLEARAVLMEDRALYLGKRRLELQGE